MKRGKWNALTDVPGVKVGHATLDNQLNEDECNRTGVTAILPHSGNLFELKTAAASFVLNGFGKTAGLIQLEELGVMESPIMLTNTFSVGAVLEGTLAYMLDENKTIGDTSSSLNVVVGECNDSHLNSMRLMNVRPNHAIEAIRGATNGPIEQGAIGAGKGMICFGMKGGIGSSSRIVPTADRNYTVGVLTLTNFGKTEECRVNEWLRQKGHTAQTMIPKSVAEASKPDGSIIIVVATDAPLDARQLKRLAKRAAIGLGRTGTHIHNGSGDIILAFSNGYLLPHQSTQITSTQLILRDDHPIMNELFQAVIEATEEAVYQSMFHADTTSGRKGRVVERWPFEVEVL